jgi:hypothetical protein
LRCGKVRGAKITGADQDGGSTGAQATADLYQDYAGARAGIGNSAVDAANFLKSNVSNAETNLYGLAELAPDGDRCPGGIECDRGATELPNARERLL